MYKHMTGAEETFVNISTSDWAIFGKYLWPVPLFNQIPVIFYVQNSQEGQIDENCLNKKEEKKDKCQWPIHDETLNNLLRQKKS